MPVLVAALTVAALTVALTGCSGGEENLSKAREYAKGDAAAIAQEARAAMRGLDTMHVAGTITQGEEAIDLDLSVSQSGDCSGTIGVGGGAIELRSVDGKAWYKADRAFWQASAPGHADRVMKQVGDRWVVLAGSLSSLRSFCRIDALTDLMLSGSANYGVEGAEMVGETATVRLSVVQPGSAIAAYVLPGDPHYVVRMTRPAAQGEDTGELAFSEFDQDFTVDAPAASDVFRLDNID